MPPHKISRIHAVSGFIGSFATLIMLAAIALSFPSTKGPSPSPRHVRPSLSDTRGNSLDQYPEPIIDGVDLILGWTRYLGDIVSIKEEMFCISENDCIIFPDYHINKMVPVDIHDVSINDRHDMMLYCSKSCMVLVRGRVLDQGILASRIDDVYGEIEMSRRLRGK
jgi:hypothetical protein